MINYIYANGCSYVAGAGLISHTKKKLNDLKYYLKTSVHLLAEELNCEYFNDAKGGGSNQRIVRTTIDWLLENKDKWNEVLVLIGWTGFFRYEIQQGKKWIPINTEESEIEFLGSKIPTTDFWKLYLKAFNDAEAMYSRYLDLILYLQLFLEANNIKYISWPTFIAKTPKRSIFFWSQKKNNYKWNYINKEHWVTKEDESWEMYLTELEKEQDVRVGTKDKDGNYDDPHPNELGNKFWYEKLKNKAKELSYI